MKILFDLAPVILFFIVFKFYGIFAATQTAVCTALIQLAVYWFKYRRFDKMLILTTLIVVILGVATLITEDEIFIKWKPTVVCWAFSLAFILSRPFTQKPLIRTMLESLVQECDGQSTLKLSQQEWQHLNTVWGFFYFLIGGLNLFVAYQYSTHVWVNFKLFGVMGLTLLFILLQAAFIAFNMEK